VNAACLSLFFFLSIFNSPFFASLLLDEQTEKKFRPVQGLGISNPPTTTTPPYSTLPNPHFLFPFTLPFLRLVDLPNPTSARFRTEWEKKGGETGGNEGE
jgi:hypothetical protein